MRIGCIGRRSFLGSVAFPCIPRLSAAPQPVFRVDVPAPTKDKPQSKLWYAQDSWWAWLPVRGGSSVWRRSETGWQRQSGLDGLLQGHPGQADVWARGDAVAAILVAPDRLSVVHLEWHSQTRRYRPAAEPRWFPMPPEPGKPGPVETATITRDGAGCWWIAYNWRRTMWVRASRDPAGSVWTGPIAVSEHPASDDDICQIVALPGAVGMIWSDQNQEAVYFRRHANQALPGSWNPAEVAARGGRTADDHISSAVAQDGTLYVATKNSVDLIGQAQLVLRVRDPRGNWTNYPYAPLTAEHAPTRPIALLGGAPQRLFLLHTVGLAGQRPRRSVIVCQSTPLPRIDLAPAARTLIEAPAALNNVTGPKAGLPPGRSGIVLASDDDGNVYEARVG